MDKGLLLISTVIIVMVFVVINMVQYTGSLETKTIEGEIIDYELYNDYIEITFETGEVIKVALKESGSGPFGNANLDFTVNSNLIVKFEKYSWWLDTNEDKWTVLQIIKVPDIGDD